MYHLSAQGVDERMINVHYYYYGLNCIYTNIFKEKKKEKKRKKKEKKTHVHLVMITMGGR